MQIRYFGFDQRENSRVHRFDIRSDGRMNPSRKTTEPALAQLGNVMVVSAFCRR